MERIEFTTINIDREYIKWDLSINELREIYWSEECDIPSLDDPVTECEMRGIPMYVNCFYDLIKLFGIDNDER